MKDAARPPYRTRYKIGTSIAQMCQFLKIAPERVYRRAGLIGDAYLAQDTGMTIEHCFALWSAIEAEAQRPNMPFEFARHVAQGGFAPAVFSFACSPTIDVGLERLSKFKPLVGPIFLSSKATARAFTIEIKSPDPTLPFPPSFATFELLCLMEILAHYSGGSIRPLTVQMPSDPATMTRLQDQLGCIVTSGPHVTIVLPAEVAKRPLLSQDPALWAVFEPELRRQLSDFETVQPMPARVRNILLELLPGGNSALQTVADRLNLSKRSLNRRLSEADTTFQTILTATRLDLARHYLAQQDIGPDEISYLLGFRDSNSFYRAFRSWTGETPMQYRHQQIE